MGRKSLIKPDRQRPNSWTIFKEDIVNLIIEALKLLRQRSDLVKDEPELNRLLYHCLGKANLLFDLPMPAYDAHNPPHLMDEQKKKREDNRPDLYWTIMDHEANYPDCYRTFALECKILGKNQITAGYLTNTLSQMAFCVSFKKIRAMERAAKRAQWLLIFWI